MKYAYAYCIFHACLWMCYSFLFHPAAAKPPSGISVHHNLSSATAIAINWPDVLGTGYSIYYQVDNVTGNFDTEEAVALIAVKLTTQAFCAIVITRSDALYSKPSPPFSHGEKSDFSCW